MPSAATGESSSLGFWANTGLVQPMRSDHTHADIELNYLFSGRMRYFLGGRFIDLPCARLAAFWAAIPHQVVEADEGTEVGWVCIPLAQFLRYNLSAKALTRLLAGDLVVDQVSSDGDAGTLRRWTADYRSGDAYDIVSMALEVEARLRRLLRGGGPARRVPAADGSGARVEAMAAWIALHYRQAITVAEIAKAAGLHPNYAMSLFRSSCGMSMWRYVTRLRLAHAQRLLATTETTTLSVAMESGFGSMNRFYEAFRREFAMPPGAFRTRNRA